MLRALRAAWPVELPRPMAMLEGGRRWLAANRHEMGAIGLTLLGILAVAGAARLLG